MTLEQLRIFVAVADREHVTRAATALGLVQSAVSAAIAALETASDVKLFHRVGRGIQLTAEGRVFLIEAKAVLARAAAAEAVLADLSGLRRGSVRVHASQTIASYWLPRHLVRFHRRYPEIEISLSVGNTAQVAEAVLLGEADIGFIEGQIDQPALSIKAIPGDRLSLVVGRSHPLAGQATITDDDLRAAQWVLREPGSGTRSEFEAALRDRGIDPATLSIVLELPTNEAVCAAVESGAGVTAVSNLVAAARLSSGALHNLKLVFPARAFHMLWHKERSRSRAMDALLTVVQSDGP